MDTRLPNGTRYINYCDWEVRKNTPYDYKRKGLLNKILSHKITESNNEILKLILSYYERSIIFLLNYTDELKHFKNPHWKNR